MPDTSRTAVQRRATKDAIRANRARPLGGRTPLYGVTLPFVRVTPETDTAVRSTAAAMGLPIAEVVRLALSAFLEANPARDTHDCMRGQ